jgi:hypothetical protein
LDHNTQTGTTDNSRVIGAIEKYIIVSEELARAKQGKYESFHISLLSIDNYFGWLVLHTLRRRMGLLLMVFLT